LRGIDPESWPTQRPPDPFLGDEWLFDPSSYANYKQLGGVLTQGAYEEADRIFHQAWQRIRRGSLEELPVGALMLSTRLTHDTRGPRRAPVFIDDAFLCDLVEDYVSDATLIAGDRFLGPWADLWRRDLQQVAVASTTWWPWLTGPARPLDRYLKARPRPDLGLRRAAKAAGIAPPMLYDAQWRPLLPLHDRFRLPAPSRGTPVPLQDGPVAGYVGRVVPLEEGGSMSICTLALPALPPLAPIRARLEQELLRLRRHERRANWETLLRDRAEVLYRLCTRFCWEDS